MNCIFNELSFSEFIDSFQKLPPAVNELCEFQALGRRFGHDIYIHRDGLYATTICGQSFRQAINQYVQDKEIKCKVYSIIDRGKPVLPDDTAVPSGYDFSCSGRAIPPTGLAECAYRIFMNESSIAYSLLCATYDANPLIVNIRSQDPGITIRVPNFISLDRFKNELDRVEPAIQCWEDIFQRAGRLSYVSIEPSARESLTREPFETSLGKAVWERLKCVEEIAASSGDTYHELVEKYCHGDNALFSDESETRINELGEKLYFTVSNERTLCSFHSKIAHRVFRIHMDKRPAPHKIVSIVHIGRKIL